MKKVFSYVGIAVCALAVVAVVLIAIAYNRTLLDSPVTNQASLQPLIFVSNLCFVLMLYCIGLVGYALIRSLLETKNEDQEEIRPRG